MTQHVGKSKTVQAVSPRQKFGRWFRLYADALNDPKVQRLPGHLFKTWINCLCIAAEADGIINAEDIPFRLRMSDHDAEIAIADLIRSGLLEYGMVNGDTCLTPHNWRTRQPNIDKSVFRMRKLRAKTKARAACDASRDADVRISSPLSTPSPRHIGKAYQEVESTYVGSDRADVADEVPL